MSGNQPPWPRAWLMTDERLGDRLWEAIARLPAGAGVILRHYGLSDSQRLELGLRLAAQASGRGLLLGVAGSRALAERIGASLVHNPDGPGELASSMAIHNEAEAVAARAAGSRLAFVGPVHPTRSHPGRPALGVARAIELAQLAGCPAVALGGMDQARFAELESAQPGAFHGFAGIDCWLSQRSRI